MASSFDPLTKEWINSLKLNKSFKSTADFENGYNFGAIFEKLQIAKGKKFKNSSDMACIFQNYKNVKDLLMENFGYDFPANNIIYRTEQLLKVIRDETIKYVEKKKVATMKAATSVNNMSTLIQPQQQKIFKTREKEINTMLSNTKFNQTAKMPKKIQEIEKKLDKYRQEKTRHELFALEERKQEIDQYRRAVQNNRDYEINKLRRLHQSTKEHERKVYDVWMKTEQVKNNRIEVDREFQKFQNEKKVKYLDALKKDEKDYVDKGVEMFQINCIRHGVDLEHDPDKPLKPEGEFNRVVIMERIKDNIKKHETDKKERIKRENKKRIEADEAKKKSQEIWQELHKLEDYQAKLAQHFSFCEETFATEQRVMAEREIRKESFKERKFVDLPIIGNEESRAEEFRKRKVQYLFHEAERVEKRWNKHTSIAEEVVEALLQTTIVGEELFLKNEGFSYGEWKEIEDVFLGFDGGKSKNKNKKGKHSEYFIDFSTFNSALRQYIEGSGSWKNYHWDQVEEPKNSEFVEFVSHLIARSYPDVPLPINDALPLHMPLKVALFGSKLAGKTSISAKISEKYGIPIIDVVELLNESFELGKPPAEEDPKKAGKKDPKKAEEPTPEKLALKEFGEKLLQQQITSIEEAKIENYIEIIKLRLNQLFTVKSDEEIISEYKEARKKEESKFEQAMKDFEEGKNKPKKESKKGAPSNDLPEEPPKPNQCFYVNGFILDGFPFSVENLKVMERELNSYICEEERINPQAQQMKKKISLVLPIPERQKDNKLKNGTFDLLAELEVSKEDLMKRKEGRKIDPQTKIVYHPEFNPIPGDVKGFADKLIDLPAVTEEAIDESLSKVSEEKKKIKEFYSGFGVETDRHEAYQQINQNEKNCQQTFENVIQVLEKGLLSKYKQIETKINEEEKKEGRNVEGPKDEGKQNEVEEKPKETEQQKQKQKEKNEEERKEESDQAQVAPVQEVENEQKDEENKDSEQQNKEQSMTISEIIRSELNSFECKEVLKKYTDNVETYEESVKQCLHALEQERHIFSKELFGVQKMFTNIINRPDDKAGKILGFQENYNKLLSEQSNIVKDTEASRHLINRLDELYDSLWNAIGGKKDEAVEQRLRFMQSSWLDDQAIKIIEITRRLLQAELDYICETIFFVLTLICKVQKKPSDYMTEYLSLGIAPEMEPINSISYDDLTRSDRLEYYLEQMQKCLQTLPRWIEQKHRKMKISRMKSTDAILEKFVEFTVAETLKKRKNIRNKITERLLEERSYYHILINKMDEWIIQGIKTENDFVYEIYKNIRKSIEDARKSNVKDLHAKQITDQFNPIRELTLNPIPLRVYTQHRKLPIFSYMVFLEEVKTLRISSTSAKNKVHFDTFMKYMDKRRKSNLLDPEILKVDYDTISQYLVKDGMIMYTELAMAVLFWDVKVFDDDALMKYRCKLLKEEPEQKISPRQNVQRMREIQTDQQIEADTEGQREEGEQTDILISPKKKQSIISMSPVSRKIELHDLVLMDGAFDEEEEYIMKHLIFQIFREDGLDYVEAQTLLDTLSMFDQLQVQKYGDTVMMLGI